MHIRALLPDATFLYISHFFRYVFPLILVPFLARHLGPDSYGLVLTALSLTTLVSIVVEYGFGVSGARDVASTTAENTATILSGVVTTKALLTGIACLFGLAVTWGSPVLDENRHFAAWALLLGIVQGFNMSWFFRAVGRTGTGIIFDLTSQSLFMASLLLLVRRPDDAVLVLALQACSLAAGQLASLVYIYHHTPFSLASWRAVRATLLRGLPMFVLAASIAGYTAAASLILAWLAGPEQVGFFGPADRLVGAALQLSLPLSALLLPHMTRAVHADADRAFRTFRTIAGILTTGAALGTGIALASAEYVLPVLLGPGFGPSVKIFSVLVLMLPISIYSQCLVMLLLIPAGQDRTVTAITLCAGAFNLVLALWLVPTHGAVGMAASRIVTEVAVAAANTIAVVRLRRARPALV